VNRILADTFYWVALIKRNDPYNEAVLKFSKALVAATLITTDEVLTFCSQDPVLRKEAVMIMRNILRGTNVRVVHQSHQTFLDGLALYEARPDKGYSLTDCISMQVMRCEGLIEVLTNDRHFEQEGFRAMFRV
jgi:predicted nucleic acid-binding protein